MASKKRFQLKVQYKYVCMASRTDALITDMLLLKQICILDNILYQVGVLPFPSFLLQFRRYTNFEEGFFRTQYCEI